ncbi:MAG: eCIS core domain-containing protein [Akkermansiaceae bacterium]
MTASIHKLSSAANKQAKTRKSVPYQAKQLRNHQRSVSDTFSQRSSVLNIQRKCACGGSCPTCKAKEDLGIQTSLRVNTPGDRWEREADSVANRVMSGSRASLTTPGSAPTISRKESSSGAKAPSTSVSNSLNLGPSKSLPNSELNYFGNRFGQDLSGVQIHDSQSAQKTADSFQAKAFTAGNHIAFAKGQYQPQSQSGRHLIAHELTHVIQQSGGSAPSMIQRQDRLIKPTKETGWKYDPVSKRWEKSGADFRRDHMTKDEQDIGDTLKKHGKWYEYGCIGVTHSLLLKTNVDNSQCYEDEAKAAKEAKLKKCPKGESGRNYAIRYWDDKKATRKADANGVYPVDNDEVNKAKPKPGGGTYTNFDYGYMQSDGSIIHANHAEPGMKVKISPTSKEFDNGYAGFNTVLYCVRCSSTVRTEEQPSPPQKDTSKQQE